MSVKKIKGYEKGDQKKEKKREALKARQANLLYVEATPAPFPYLSVAALTNKDNAAAAGECFEAGLVILYVEYDDKDNDNDISLTIWAARD